MNLTDTVRSLTPPDETSDDVDIEIYLRHADNLATIVSAVFGGCDGPPGEAWQQEGEAERLLRRATRCYVATRAYILAVAAPSDVTALVGAVIADAMAGEDEDG